MFRKKTHKHTWYLARQAIWFWKFPGRFANGIYEARGNFQPMSKSHPPITSSASQEAHFLHWAGGKPDALHVESRFALNDVLYNLNGQSWKNEEPGAVTASAKPFHSLDFAEFLEEYCQTKIRIYGQLPVVKKKRKDNPPHGETHHSLLLSLFSGSSSVFSPSNKKNTLMQLGMHIVDHDPSKRPSDDLAFQTSTSSPEKEIGERGFVTQSFYGMKQLIYSFPRKKLRCFLKSDHFKRVVVF